MARKRKRHEAESNGESFPRTRKPVEVTPRNRKQRDYIRAIQTNDIIFGMGSAGTGKTYLAAKLAMKSFTDGEIDKIVICRPAVTAGGEDLGFLPGGIKDKMDPFIQPIFDAFKEYWSMQTINTYLRDGKIEIVPLAYMRGRSFKNAFIIADEMQNATPENLLMLLTRLDEGSKIVITGDPLQSDVNGHSCFRNAQGILSRVDHIAFVLFDDADIVRHRTVANILRAWPKNGFTIEQNSGFGDSTPAFLQG